MSKVMSRNQSAMQIQSNPLEVADEHIVTVKVENLSDAHPIEEEELKALINKLSREE